MQRILKLAIFLPILFALSQFLWGLLPIVLLPNPIRLVVNDATGPVFLMSMIIWLSCLLFWRLPVIGNFVRFLFDTNICFEGTWKGILHYEWEGEKTKPAYLIIKQANAFSINVWLLTDERTSVSKTASIIPYNGIYRLMYEYGVEDSPDNKGRNPLHTGFCTLDLHSNGKTKNINGLYCTSRNTVGKMIFTQKNWKSTMDYHFAEKLFS
ncbi:MAG: hypothetical protein LBE13_06155 [Bacteroidales bacterium]|jgi:hypothetical protein|nr:hypothetical protein [Bacteroidales bacterium]